MKKVKREEIIMVILALIIGLFVGYFIFNGGKAENLVSTLVEDSSLEENENMIVNESNVNPKENNDEELKEIIVYITGSVKKPGVYDMEEGDRIIDLFQKAGGESIGANLEEINMASYLKDGEKIYIPNLSEAGSNREETINSLYDSNEKTNINFATQSELEKLSGIGPSKASAIIKYRNENGNFNNVKELIKVSGIGPATMSNIEDEVCVK